MRTQFIALWSSALLALCITAVPAAAQQKTAKACHAEWQANKADNQAKGITEKAYVAQCRGGDATPAASAPAAPATTAPSTTAPSTTATAKPASSAAAKPTGENQFATEAEAKSHCPSDTVVWANLKSKIYHFSGHKNYGNGKEGAFICEKDATAQGIRASKAEKRPG